MRLPLRRHGGRARDFGFRSGAFAASAACGSHSRGHRAKKCATRCSISLEPATIIIKSAAVADYYVADVPRQKRKKTATRLSLELDPTPDILAELGQKKGDRLLVGFAAETENLIEEARRKMTTKKCDMVVANLVSGKGHGFRIGSQ